jgi:single stranded DNA-binding protein
MNQITIIGFTGSDAEAHYTKNGTLVVTLSVATKESWKDADGSWQSRTDWHRIVFREAGGVHADTDQRLVCDGARRFAHSRV